MMVLHLVDQRAVQLVGDLVVSRDLEMVVLLVVMMVDELVEMMVEMRVEWKDRK